MRRIITAREQYEQMELLKDPRRVDPDYFTGVHEFGHVMDMQGQTDQIGRNTRARSRIEDTLRSFFEQANPQFEYRPDMSTLEGEHYRKNLEHWLRNQLPGGAFQGNTGIGSYGGMNLAEGLAHAFTEGELNPQANELSKALHKVVVEESRPETSQVLKERMENPYFRKSWEKQYGPYAGYNEEPPAGNTEPPKIGEGVPWGLTDSVMDMHEKYPHTTLKSLTVDPHNSGGVAFVTPDMRSSLFGPDKSTPRMQVEQQWADTPMSGEFPEEVRNKYRGVDNAPVASWESWMDKSTDEGFFPRWQSTTAGEPWPEDHIEDAWSEFDYQKGIKPKQAMPTLYHHTSPESAQSIREQGRFESPYGDPNAWFTEDAGLTGFGDAAVAVDVPDDFPLHRIDPREEHGIEASPWIPIRANDIDPDWIQRG